MELFRLLPKLRKWIGNDFAYELILVALILVVSFLLARLVRYFVKKIAIPLTKKTKTTLDDQLIPLFGSAAYRGVIIVGLYTALSVFKAGFKLISHSSGRKLIDEYDFLADVVVIADAILFVIAVLMMVTLSFKVINVLFEWYAEKINAEENKDLSGSLFPLLQKVSKFLLAAVAIVILLAKFDVDISGLIVSLGVGSLAIALAAQETISNMIAGFIIMTDRPFRIGDRIRIGNDLVGDITEIGIRSTKILDFDSNLIIIPNNEIIKSRIVNISYPTHLTRVVVDLGVAYGSDVELVKSLLLQAANEHPKVSKEILPEVFFMNFGDSSLNFRLAARTDEYRDAFNIGCELRETINKLFLQHKIEIPFPQRVVHLKKEN